MAVPLTRSGDHRVLLRYRPGIVYLAARISVATWVIVLLATFAAVMIFPIIGVIADQRRSGHVHPAWRWAIAAMVASLLLTEAISYSPLGDAVYRGVTAGSPGAAVAPLDFPPPPAGPLVTGRSVGH